MIKGLEAYGGECLKSMAKVWDEYDKSVGEFRWRAPECLKVSEDYD